MTFWLKLTAIAVLASLLVSTRSFAQESFESLIDGAEVSEGPVSIYRKDGSYLVSLAPDVFDRTLFWSAEVARYPADAISIGGTEIATHAVRLEERDANILVRSLSSGSIRQGTDPTFGDNAALKLQPINIAIANAQIGPVLLSLPIVAEADDGRILVDATTAFTSDIPDFSVKPQIMTAGLVPIAVDPARSYVVRATAFPQNIFYVSHLTFVAQDANGADRAVSVEVAHTIALLPDDPMEQRVFDPRVGYFTTEVLRFAGSEGNPSERVKMALRHRLVHADPDAALPSDPVEPLVYYLSPEIPDRWRPYIRAAIEDWQPAFEAAGFTNAIIARDAPTADEDPNWSINDARYNVIRWVAQPIPNALGPNVHDPRTGEIISAHILVWPDVINLFEEYYFLLMSDLDPDAQTLPLPEEVQGRILRYAVSHEVGHSLGLRHNHRASTAWTTEQLRDADFTDQFGSTASIMAYGRFNYVARPQDRIRRYLPMIGVYDRHAITWGYTPNLDAAALDRIAANPTLRPELAWGAGELPAEALGQFDPTILTENIGSDRIVATRAAMERLDSSLTRLRQIADTGPRRAMLIERVYSQASQRYLGFSDSVNQMVGGFLSTAEDGAPTQFVPVDDQRAAIAFLVGEAIDNLEMFSDPELLLEFRPAGGLEGVNAMAGKIIGDLLDPVTIRRVYGQNVLQPERDFGVAEMLAAITDEMLADDLPLAELSVPRRAALARYVTLLQQLPTYGGQPGATILTALGFPKGVADLAAADLSDTGIAAAATVEIERLVTALSPQEDGLATRLFKDLERAIGIDVDAEEESKSTE